MKKVIVQCLVVRNIEMEITEEEEQRLLNYDLPWRITETICKKIEEKGDCFSEILPLMTKKPMNHFLRYNIPLFYLYV